MRKSFNGLTYLAIFGVTVLLLVSGLNIKSRNTNRVNADDQAKYEIKVEFPVGEVLKYEVNDYTLLSDSRISFTLADGTKITTSTDRVLITRIR